MISFLFIYIPKLVWGRQRIWFIYLIYIPHSGSYYPIMTIIGPLQQNYSHNTSCEVIITSSVSKNYLCSNDFSRNYLLLICTLFSSPSQIAFVKCVWDKVWWSCCYWEIWHLIPINWRRRKKKPKQSNSVQIERLNLKLKHF